MSEQPSSTSPHPNCPLCANPDRAQYVSEEEDSVFATGEIVILQESVHTPIRHIFDASGSPLVIHLSQPDISTGQLGSLRDSLHAQAPSERTNLTSITWPSSVGSPPRRPAVIWPSLEGEPDDGGQFVCLMTGYRGAHAFVHLPRILQHFCMPISPHELGDPDRPHDHHLHTHPEWQKEYQWFIAYPFHSMGRIHGRWCWNDAEGNRTSHASFRLTKERLAELEDIWTKRFEELTRMCVEQPGLLEQYLVEYKQFVDQSRGLRTPNASRTIFPTTAPTIPSALPAETATPGPSAPAAIPSTPVDASSLAEGSGGRPRRKRGKRVQRIKRVFGIDT